MLCSQAYCVIVMFLCLNEEEICTKAMVFKFDRFKFSKVSDAF